MNPEYVFDDISKTFPKLNLETRVNLSLVALGLRPGYIKLEDKNISPNLNKNSLVNYGLYYPKFANTPIKKKVYDKYFSKGIYLQFPTQESYQFIITKKGDASTVVKYIKKSLNNGVSQCVIIGKILGFGKFSHNLSFRNKYSYDFLVGKPGNAFVENIITIVRPNVEKNSKNKLKNDDEYIIKMAERFENGFFKHIPNLHLYVERHYTVRELKGLFPNN